MDRVDELKTILDAGVDLKGEITHIDINALTSEIKCSMRTGNYQIDCTFRITDSKVSDSGRQSRIDRNNAIIELYVKGGITQREIANMLHLSESTVNKIIKSGSDCK